MFSVTTNWISRSVPSGEDIVKAVHAVGLDTVELGYSLTHGQAEDIIKAAQAGRIKISSLHAFCPAEPFATSPEAYTLCDTWASPRKRAVAALERTAHFTAKAGARIVVVHGGHMAAVRRVMATLTELAESGKRHTEKYARQMDKVLTRRERKSPKYFDALVNSLDDVMPTFERLGLVLAIENMPTVYAMPIETEMLQLFERYPQKVFGYWHDLGHADIRERHGFIHHESLLKRFVPRLVGAHIHSSDGYADQHTLPPNRSLKYEKFKFLAGLGIPLVLEPVSSSTPDDVRNAIAFLRETWT